MLLFFFEVADCMYSRNVADRCKLWYSKTVSKQDLINKLLNKGRKKIRHIQCLCKYNAKKHQALKISDKKLNSNDFTSSTKIAIHFHVFYTDLIEEIYNHVSSIKYPVTLFITVVSDKDKEFVSNFFSNHKTSHDVRIIKTDNRGRDIYPFYKALHDCYKDFEIIAHFHTKRSLHTNYGDIWRKYIYNNLIGTNHLFDNIINYMNLNKTIGFITTPIVPIKSIIYSYYDFLENKIDCKEAISNSLKVFGIDTGDVYTVPYNKEFPCGNMFIARRDAIQQFLSAELTDNNFPAEEGQLNGTLQHYVELIWSYMVSINKYQYMEIQKR